MYRYPSFDTVDRFRKTSLTNVWKRFFKKNIEIYKSVFVQIIVILSQFPSILSVLLRTDN